MDVALHGGPPTVLWWRPEGRRHKTARPLGFYENVERFWSPVEGARVSPEGGNPALEQEICSTAEAADKIRVVGIRIT
jgi:hypothetical protein